MSYELVNISGYNLAATIVREKPTAELTSICDGSGGVKLDERSI